MDNSEAPFVAWTNIERGGFTWSVTVRKGMTPHDITALFDLIQKTQEEAVARGYSYKEQRGGYPKKEVQYADYPCPICMSKVIAGTTKAGKKYEKCSTQKWDAQQNKPLGCVYIKWL